MMKPAAKQGDTITATDTHLVIAPTGVVTPMSCRFVGVIDADLEPTVLIEHQPAAVHASLATNVVAHVAVGGTFQRPPTNLAMIVVGARTVIANHKPLARQGDAAITCNDPVNAPVGTVVAGGSVLVG